MKVLKDRQCNDCGKLFNVQLDDKNKILTDCYYGGKMRFGIGDWSHSTLNREKSTKDEFVWDRCHPWYRELYYHLRDLKRIILHQYNEVEYWECVECLEEARKKFD